MNAADLAVAYGAGFVAGCGPCAAPRFVALLALTADAPRLVAARRTLSFALGSAAAYVVVAGAVSSAAAVAQLRQSYVLLSLACFSGAVATMRLGSSRSCPARCDGHAPVRTGPAFVGGFVTAAIATPCCLPMLALIAGPDGTAGAVAKTAAFVCGQLGPVVLVSGAETWLRNLVRPERLHLAGSTVCGGLMLFLSGYYALIA